MERSKLIDRGQHCFSLNNCARGILAGRHFSPRAMINTVNATICRIFDKAQRMWDEFSAGRRRTSQRHALHHDDPAEASGAARGKHKKRPVTLPLELILLCSRQPWPTHINRKAPRRCPFGDFRPSSTRSPRLLVIRTMGMAQACARLQTMATRHIRVPAPSTLTACLHVSKASETYARLLAGITPLNMVPPSPPVRHIVSCR